jgi:hypothetical protein
MVSPGGRPVARNASGRFLLSEAWICRPLDWKPTNQIWLPGLVTVTVPLPPVPLTVSEYVAVCVVLPAVPVTVTEYVPAGVDAEVPIVS